VIETNFRQQSASSVMNPGDRMWTCGQLKLPAPMVCCFRFLLFSAGIEPLQDTVLLVY
jgi:hypothetical protein